MPLFKFLDMDVDIMELLKEFGCAGLMFIVMVLVFKTIWNKQKMNRGGRDD